jgi:hypothetical protein
VMTAGRRVATVSDAMNLATLLAAMLAVESGGDDFARGDGGRARGALQIHRAVVLDVNRIAGTHYRHTDAHDRDTAMLMATVYLTHYVTKERLGRQPTAEDYARAWNGGGPEGWKKKSTKIYWLKVKNKMDIKNPK